MAWSDPSNPVSSTVITVAYAVANFLTQIRWLRILTGGADPPGTGYIVTSDSTTATSWKNGVTAILAVLGYTPVNKAGDSGIGALSATSFAASGNVTAGGAVNSTGSMSVGTSLAVGTTASIAGKLTMPTDNVGIQFSSGTHMRDNAAFPGLVITAESGSYNFYNEDASVLVFQALAAAAAPLFKGQTMYHSGNLPTSGDVPSGAVVWFETLAELTAAGAGWARYTAADGRLLVGAGASASSQTFVQATNYGSDWTPAVGVTVSDTIAVNNGTLAASEAASASTTIVAGAAGITVSLGSHTHVITLSGSVARSGSAAIAGTSTAWVPYMRAGVWGRKV